MHNLWFRFVFVFVIFTWFLAGCNVKSETNGPEIYEDAGRDADTGDNSEAGADCEADTCCNSDGTACAYGCDGLNCYPECNPVGICCNPDGTACAHGCDGLNCYPECNPLEACCEPDGTVKPCDHGCNPTTETCYPDCDPAGTCCNPDGTACAYGCEGGNCSCQVSDGKMYSCRGNQGEGDICVDFPVATWTCADAAVACESLTDYTWSETNCAVDNFAADWRCETAYWGWTEFSPFYIYDPSMPSIVCTGLLNGTEVSRPGDTWTDYP